MRLYSPISLTERDILDLISNDPWMMRVLRAAEALTLPDWMIGAGFVRNKVWDHLHGFANGEVQTADIDLIYFDAGNLDEGREKDYDRRLKALCDVNWSCKNQARMHAANQESPYASTTDALARWVETATCVAVTLQGGGLKLIAPHGTDDLIHLVVRQNPLFSGETEQFLARVTQKKWLEKWPKLQMTLT